MKSFLGLAFLVSQAAFGSVAPQNIEAHCSTRYVADSGFEVLITKAEGNVLNARLSRITFAGSFVVSDSRVVRMDDQNLDQRTYSGKNLEILVDLNKVVSEGSFEAKLSGVLMNQAQDADLVCHLTEVTAQVQPVVGPAPGTITCMAYWQGAVFDPSTHSCVEMGTSGCSNPFEFLNVAECENAFRSRFFK